MRLSALPTLVHEPLLSPQPDATRSMAFLVAWQELMSRPVPGHEDGQGWCLLHTILSDLPNGVTQSHASVAATFVTWLGTHAGLEFLESARILSIELGDSQLGYSLAWSNLSRQRQDVYQLPAVFISDCEVIHLIVEWLGSSDGVSFTRGCRGVRKKHGVKLMPSELMDKVAAECFEYFSEMASRQIKEGPNE